MQFISCHDGRIFTANRQCQLSGTGKRPFKTGLTALDELLPAGALACGAVHEILARPQDGAARFFALLLARAAGGWIVWCDPKPTPSPHAIAAAGVKMEKLFLLHPGTQADQTCAIAECMQCKGVAATIAQADKLSRIEARRYQLAAEKG